MASRSQWFAALAGLVLLGLWLLLGREPGAVRPEGAAPPVGASDDRRPETRETLELGAPEPVGAAAERALANAPTAPMPAAQEATEPGPGLCRLRGRLVDGQGRPLAGQVVVLYALGTWPEATGTQPIAASRGLPGFETRSDAEGAFRFEFPPPAVGANLIAGFDPLVGQRVLLFSAGRPDALAPLEPGIRELGDLVLPAAAAISGRVLSSEGRPLAQVLLSSSGQGWDTLGQSATSDAEGRFVLGGIQASRAGVSASALEHQSAFAGPFDLTPGQIHGPIEIRLEPGGRLEGRVVGAQGEPLAGVRIDLLPNGGRIVTTESDAQGRFEAVLQTPGAHRLLARREGYRARDIGEGLLEVEAGTPVELVLEPEAVTEFLVQDALTGAAIERFTLTVQPGRSGYFAAGPAPGSPAPEPGFHAQGRLRTAAGEQDRVRVQAPGYAALQARVVWDAPGQATCTLRLEPAARLSGRIQSAGSGVADVRLILAQSRSQTNLEARTGPEGGFEFAELAPGSYTLEAHASTGVLRRADIRLQAAERRDLGPLELAASGSLRVRLRPPPGQSAAGLGLRLEDSLQSPLASSDGDGLARFEGLPPGPARVRFEGAAQRFAASSWMPVEIEPGRETQLEIDLAPLAACRIEVELVAPKLGGAAVRLSLAAPKELRDEGIPWLVHPSLVDAEGRWVGFAFPAGQASIDAWVDSLPDWNWTGPEVRPSPGGLIQERLELPAAELLLDWQEAQDWPLDLRLELALSALEAPAEAGSAARRELSATLPFDRRTPGALQGSAAELLAPGRLRWSALPPGRWRVGLRLCSASGETLLRSASADLDLPANGNAELSLR